MEKIRVEMVAGKENVMLDTRHLTTEQISQLRAAIQSAGDRLPLQVLWWP